MKEWNCGEHSINDSYIIIIIIIIFQKFKKSLWIHYLCFKKYWVGLREY